MRHSLRARVATRASTKRDSKQASQDSEPVSQKAQEIRSRKTFERPETGGQFRPFAWHFSVSESPSFPLPPASRGIVGRNFQFKKRREISYWNGGLVTTRTSAGVLMVHQRGRNFRGCPRDRLDQVRLEPVSRNCRTGLRQDPRNSSRKNLQASRDWTRIPAFHAPYFGLRTRKDSTAARNLRTRRAQSWNQNTV